MSDNLKISETRLVWNAAESIVEKTVVLRDSLTSVSKTPAGENILEQNNSYKRATFFVGGGDSSSDEDQPPIWYKEKESCDKDLDILEEVALEKVDRYSLNYIKEKLTTLPTILEEDELSAEDYTTKNLSLNQGTSSGFQQNQGTESACSSGRIIWDGVLNTPSEEVPNCEKFSWANNTALDMHQLRDEEDEGNDYNADDEDDGNDDDYDSPSPDDETPGRPLQPLISLCQLERYFELLKSKQTIEVMGNCLLKHVEGDFTVLPTLCEEDEFAAVDPITIQPTQIQGTSLGSPHFEKTETSGQQHSSSVLLDTPPRELSSFKALSRRCKATWDMPSMNLDGDYFS